jgi:hypothetical protein
MAASAADSQPLVLKPRHRLRPRDAIGHRIADQQAEQGRHAGEQQRSQIGRHVQWILQQQRVARHVHAQRQRAVAGLLEQRGIRRHLPEHRLGKADPRHDQERHREEQPQPQHRDQLDQQPPAPRAELVAHHPEEAEQVADDIRPEAPRAFVAARVHEASTTAPVAGQLSHSVSSQS